MSVVKVPDERRRPPRRAVQPEEDDLRRRHLRRRRHPGRRAREGTVNPDVLAQIRNADALLHVARAFDDPTAPDAGRPVARRRRPRPRVHGRRPDGHREAPREAATQGRHGSQAEREQAQREEELLERLEPHLSDGQPIRSFGLTDDEELLLRGYRFLTQKPVLVVLNIDEGRLPEAAALEEAGPRALRRSRRPTSRPWPGRSRPSSASCPRRTRGSSWTTSASPSRRAAASSA